MEWTNAFDKCLKASSVATFSLATAVKAVPFARTCVARGWLFNDRSTNVVLFTTDRRMAKLDQLKHNRQFEACFYFKDQDSQFRLSGSAFPIDGETEHPLPDDLGLKGPVSSARWKQEYDRVWNSLSKTMQLSFSKPPPGSPLTPDAKKLLDDVFDQRIEPTTDNFVVVALRPTKVDYFKDEGPGKRVEYELKGTWKTQEVCP